MFVFLHFQICRCRASCINDENEPIQEGGNWLRNACTTCTCEVGGRVNCKETVCSVACSDPLPPEPNTCCPVCPITVSWSIWSLSLSKIERARVNQQLEIIQTNRNNGKRSFIKVIIWFNLNCCLSIINSFTYIYIYIRTGWVI